MLSNIEILPSEQVSSPNGVVPSSNKRISNTRYYRSIELDFEGTFANYYKEEADFRPFISGIDLEQEILILNNPSNEPVSLENYSVQDSKHLHIYKFPSDTTIEPNSVLYLYTCPGGSHGSGELNRPFVLWKNTDGSLRKKEVLNNGKLDMVYSFTFLFKHWHIYISI